MHDEKNNISSIFATANDRFDEIPADADDPNCRYHYNYSIVESEIWKIIWKRSLMVKIYVSSVVGGAVDEPWNRLIARRSTGAQKRAQGS